MLNKKELRSSIEKYFTIKGAIKEIKNQVNLYKEGIKVYVRCFTCEVWEDITNDLMIEIEDNGEWYSISIACINAKANKYDYWEFMNITNDIFKTMKKNVIKELNSIGIQDINTEDYNL